MFDFFLAIISASILFLIFHYIKKQYFNPPTYNFKLSRDYLVGINYLLNEQEDRALEVFIKLLEVDKDTVETHLALGALFRRKGEVDKAIRIHQNLIARPQLTQSQRLDALLALGNDYLMAGVLDRAERVFLDLQQAKDEHSSLALYSLLDIYQLEKSWRKSIQIAKKIQEVTGESMSKVIAHHYCELSENALIAHDVPGAIKYLKSALSIDKESIRANLLDAKIFLLTHRYKKALKAYQKVVNVNVEFLSEAFSGIMECYEEMGDIKSGYEYIKYLQELNPKTSIILVLFDALLGSDQDQAQSQSNIDFLSSQIAKFPSLSGLVRLINLYHEQLGESQEEGILLGKLNNIGNKLIGNSFGYKCNHCGFTSNALEWHCKSCFKWDTAVPVIQ